MMGYAPDVVLKRRPEGQDAGAAQIQIWTNNALTEEVLIVLKQVGFQVKRKPPQ